MRYDAIIFSSLKVMAGQQQKKKRSFVGRPIVGFFSRTIRESHGATSAGFIGIGANFSLYIIMIALFMGVIFAIVKRAQHGSPFGVKRSTLPYYSQTAGLV